MNEEMFPNQDDQVLGPGKLLQVAREEKNLRPEDVAYEIRLTPSQVLALEENDYSRMPEETYIRGYLRNYARLVDIPENDILMAFARLTRSSEKKLQPVMPASESDINKGGKGIRLLAVFIIIAVIAVSAVWVLEPYDKLIGKDTVEKTATPVAEEKTVLKEVPIGASTLNLGTPAESNVVEETSITSITAAEPLPVDKPVSVVQAQPAASVVQEAITTPVETVQVQRETQTEATSPTQAAEAVETIVAVETAEAPQANTTATNAVIETDIGTQVAGEGTLSISYEKDSWTDVRDANGKKLLYRTVKKGEKITLAGKLPMSLFFGFAQGVKVSFNGQEIDVPAYTRGVFARFTVGEAVNP